MTTLDDILSGLVTASKNEDEQQVIALINQLLNDKLLIAQLNKIQIKALQTSYDYLLTPEQGNILKSRFLSLVLDDLRKALIPKNNLLSPKTAIDTFFKYPNSSLYLSALQANDILLILYHSPDHKDKEDLIGRFNRLSAYDRNQAVLKYCLDEQLNFDLPEEIKLQLSPATTTLLDTQGLTTDEKNPLRALANNQLNSKIYILLEKNPAELSVEQNELVEYWKILQDERFKELLSNIIKPTDQSIALSFLSSDPDKKSRKDDNLLSKSDDSIINTPHGVYKIFHENKLGEGAQGKVKRGINLLTGEIVAIKVFTYDPNNIDIEIDARVAAHNLRRIRESIDEVVLSGRGKTHDITKHYIVMKYAHGDNLQNFLYNTDINKNLTTKKTISFEDRKSLAKSFITKLKSRHDAGWIIRDIKISNCIANNKNDITLVDLDHIKNKSDTWRSREMYSAGYIAPELPEQSQSQESDRYAAGAVIATIFTPYNHDNLEFIPQYALESQVEHYIDQEPTDYFAKEMWLICKQLLKSDPNKRLSLEEALKRIAAIEKYQAAMGALEKLEDGSLGKQIHTIITNIVQNHSKKLYHTSDPSYFPSPFERVDLDLLTRVAEQTLDISNGVKTNLNEYLQLATEIKGKYHSSGKKLAWLMVGLVVLATVGFAIAASGGLAIPVIAAIAKIGAVYCSLFTVASAGLGLYSGYYTKEKNTILTPLFDKIHAEDTTPKPNAFGILPYKI